MLHLRVGVALTVACVSAHASYVWRERVQRAPSNRFLYFSPGSQDASVADTLRTGDLILFKRNCSLSAGAAGLCCVARQSTSSAAAGGGGGGGGFDGAGVIVLRSGIPYVLEARPGGGVPRLRRYEARIQSSRAREILIRPLQPPLEANQAAALEAHAISVVAGGVQNNSTDVGVDNATAFFDATASARALLETAALLTRVSGANTSIRAVETAAVAAGMMINIDDDAKTNGLAPPSQPWAPHTHFGSPVWVRDLR